MKRHSPLLGIFLIAVGLSMLGYKFTHLKPVIAAVLIFFGVSMIFEWIMSKR